MHKNACKWYDNTFAQEALSQNGTVGVVVAMYKEGIKEHLELPICETHVPTKHTPREIYKRVILKASESRSTNIQWTVRGPWVFLNKMTNKMSK